MLFKCELIKYRSLDIEIKNLIFPKKIKIVIYFSNQNQSFLKCNFDYHYRLTRVWRTRFIQDWDLLVMNLSLRGSIPTNSNKKKYLINFMRIFHIFFLEK